MSKAKPTYLVSIDTQTLIWAVRQEGTAGELQRAKWLFEELDAANAQVVIPTVVIGEYLVRPDKKLHTRIIDAINRQWGEKCYGRIR